MSSEDERRFLITSQGTGPVSRTAMRLRLEFAIPGKMESRKNLTN